MTQFISFSFFTLISFTTFFTFAENPQSVARCAAANGNIAHALYETDTNFISRIAFPSYRSNNGERKLNVPLSNDNAFSNNLEFLKEKTEVFRDIFKGLRYLETHFEKNECAHVKNDTHVVWLCSSKKQRTLGTTKVDLIEVSIENQTRKNVFENAIKAYYATLTVKTPPNDAGLSKQYTSSFTYYPNGSDIQCDYRL